MGCFLFDLTQDGILNGLGITFEKKTEPNLENCSLQRVLIMLLWMLRVRKIGLKMKGSPRLAGPGLVMWPKFRSGLGSPRNLRYGFFKPMFFKLIFFNPYFIKPIFYWFYHIHILTNPYFIKPMFFQTHIDLHMSNILFNSKLTLINIFWEGKT